MGEAAKASARAEHAETLERAEEAKTKAALAELEQGKQSLAKEHAELQKAQHDAAAATAAAEAATSDKDKAEAKAALALAKEKEVEAQAKAAAADAEHFRLEADNIRRANDTLTSNLATAKQHERDMVDADEATKAAAQKKIAELQAQVAEEHAQTKTAQKEANELLKTLVAEMELEERATQALEAEHAKFVELGNKEEAEKKALEVAEATVKSQEAKLEHAKADAAAADASHRRYEIELANAIREGKSEQAVADAKLLAAEQRTIAAQRREASANAIATYNVRLLNGTRNKEPPPNDSYTIVTASNTPMVTDIVYINKYI